MATAQLVTAHGSSHTLLVAWLGDLAGPSTNRVKAVVGVSISLDVLRIAHSAKRLG
jgi:hypothetical protein